MPRPRELVPTSSYFYGEERPALSAPTLVARETSCGLASTVPPLSASLLRLLRAEDPVDAPFPSRQSLAVIHDMIVHLIAEVGPLCALETLDAGRSVISTADVLAAFRAAIAPHGPSLAAAASSGATAAAAAIASAPPPTAAAGVDALRVAARVELPVAWLSRIFKRVASVKSGEVLSKGRALGSKCIVSIGDAAVAAFAGGIEVVARALLRTAAGATRAEGGRFITPASIQAGLETNHELYSLFLGNRCAISGAARDSEASDDDVDSVHEADDGENTAGNDDENGNVSDSTGNKSAEFASPRIFENFSQAFLHAAIAMDEEKGLYRELKKAHEFFSTDERPALCTSSPLESVAWHDSGNDEYEHLTAWPLALVDKLCAELDAIATGPPIPAVGPTFTELVKRLHAAGLTVTGNEKMNDAFRVKKGNAYWSGDSDLPYTIEAACESTSDEEAAMMLDSYVSDVRVNAKKATFALRRVAGALRDYQSVVNSNQASAFLNALPHYSGVAIAEVDRHRGFFSGGPDRLIESAEECAEIAEWCKYFGPTPRGFVRERITLPEKLYNAWLVTVTVAERVLDRGGALAGATPFSWRGVRGVYSRDGRIAAPRLANASIHLNRLIREMAQEFKTDLRFTQGAIACCSAVAEETLVKTFKEVALALAEDGGDVIAN